MSPILGGTMTPYSDTKPQASELDRRLSVGDIRKRLVYRGSEPEDFEDDYLRWLVKELYTKFDVVLVTVFDADEYHIGVTFRNKKACSPGTLEFMMENGFQVAQAGVQDYEYTNGGYYQNARAEFRPLAGGLDELIRSFYAERNIS